MDAAEAGRGGAGPKSVLGKVAAVLYAFTADDTGVSLAELARRTGIAKGTLHRLAGEMVEVRLLERAGRGYRLSGQVFQLGMRASVERGLLEVATPFMEDLYERTHETVHLGVLEGTEVVYVAKIGGHRQAAAPSRIGGRMPLYCTAIGKALLAFGPPELFGVVVEGGLTRRTTRTITAPGLLRRQVARIAETGVAFEYEESAPGIVCVAAPVLDPFDRPVAAVSVTGPATRFRPEAHRTSVKAAAAGIAGTLARRAALRAD
ncbi:IclR family transcriptional regulator [Actinocorallia sp. API 0066]|uniref:IclR family transcriptional regulator n=1 Tax=Actinocorallia sp. API 0066 TaxID=2896846 RepID=UPI001E4FAA28|nr:IclR family transcriptional regulator [Actinocorallia sp. API 0066]MCD0449778.1 IclR family transcriptional regulator [Actinocorallia sp. API 0066]